ncbi:MAG: recombinase family protein [Oscillospiraceae bacterium]|nr:recombinase family protein [Oscillospiraceae bacterium]
MPQITTIPAFDLPTPVQLRMAAYCRVSSDSADQLYSYAAQVRHYTEYINANPDWTLVDIYADEGITGTESGKRNEFQRLLADCRRGKIDRVLCKSISRFARNTEDCLNAVRLLKSLGVTVFYEHENLDTADMDGEFLLTMQGMVAQEESMSISRNLRWAVRKRMADGTYISSSTPFGYRLLDDQLVIVENEAMVVRQIFEWYLSGLGLMAIIHRLQQEHPEKIWHRSAVKYILNNEHYIGDALLQKNFTSESLPFRKQCNHGELAQYYVENYNVPIISREIFEAAQQLREQRKTAPADSVGQHALSGKLRCTCGASFRRKMVNGTAYWACKNHNADATNCPMKAIPESTIHETCLLFFNKLITHGEQILPPMIAQLENLQSKANGTQQKVYQIDQQLAALTAQQLALTRLYNKGMLLDAAFTAQKNKLSGEISKLRTDRRNALRINDNDDQLNQLRALQESLDGLSMQGDFDAELFREVVQHIVPSPTELNITLMGGLELTQALPNLERRWRR